MKKILLFILLGSISLAQEKENKIIVQDYPKNQQFYIDGEVQFYKELHQVFIDKKLKPCDNKNELYTAWIVINPDASIVIPEEKDVEDINEIRCTYNLVRESFKYLNKWQPILDDLMEESSGIQDCRYVLDMHDINNFMSNFFCEGIHNLIKQSIYTSRRNTDKYRFENRAVKVSILREIFEEKSFKYLF